jgi:large subunit ribosomal protein L22
MKAHLRKVRISHKKTNVVAEMIRKKSAVEALRILKLTPKKAAEVLYKVLHSAVLNAETNHDKKRENLRIGTLIVNKGPVLKRSLPSSRGRTLPIQKPMTHISVILEEMEEKTKKPVVKATKVAKKVVQPKEVKTEKSKVKS